jgi:glutamate-1-semialdehyde 2,1-aminomutase
MTPETSVEEPTGVHPLIVAAHKEIRAARPRSAAHYDRAVERLPRGTTRARFWEPMPIYVERAYGAYLQDIDDIEYIDCNLGQGPLILGNSHPVVVAALQAQLHRGTHYGPPSQLSAELAELIVGAVPGSERVLFTNSGTEATMGALRIARAATGRHKVAKFEGGWHGANEFVLHSFTTISGDPAQASANPDSAGISNLATDQVVVLPFNNEAAFDRLRTEGHEISCVIVEPVQGGAGCLPASRAFLQALRSICDEIGTILIFDEVITGFRLGPRSGAGSFGVTADLTTLGKAIGGGLPVGAICGRADLMAPTESARWGPAGRAVAVGGTFSGNPMTMAAGIAQISELLDHPEHYARLHSLGERMRDGLSRVVASLGIRGFVTGMGSMMRLHFTSKPPTSVRDLSDDNHLASMLLRVYLELEGVLRGMSFVSTAHTETDVDRVVRSHEVALKRLQAEGIL